MCPNSFQFLNAESGAVCTICAALCEKQYSGPHFSVGMFCQASGTLKFVFMLS